MKLKQNIKLIINNKEREAIPFLNYRDAQSWTKQEAAKEGKNIKINWYGKYSWDIEYLDTKNILKIRFY